MEGKQTDAAPHGTNRSIVRPYHFDKLVYKSTDTTIIYEQGLTPDMSRPYITQTLGALTREQMFQ